MSSNFAHNIALVGAGGNQGKYIAEELVKGGKHTVTAITRANSKAEFPAGVVSKVVDYNDKASLVEGLRGQDALVITMSVTAPPDTQIKLIDAAKEAGVKFIIPNEWGYDSDRVPGMARDMLLGDRVLSIRDYCESKGIPYIGVEGGFWYEFSLGGSHIRYGFEIEKREFTRIDGGDIKISTSTWAQVARGTAGLLSLKIAPESESDKDATISSFYNKSVCVESFKLSQNDMFEALKRVTGTTDADWKITVENYQERYDRAIKMFQAGDFQGFGMAMYTRAFFPDEAANMPVLQNKLFNLPQEDLDESTKAAVNFAKIFNAESYTRPHANP